jgi:hypothetical protein
MFIAVLFIIALNWKPPTSLLADDWMDKQTVAYPFNGIILRNKNYEYLTYTTHWLSK